MFERRVYTYIKTLLSEYVQDFDEDALKVSVWKGAITLENLRLRKDVLRDLDLPISVQAGIIGRLELNIPWGFLGKRAVVAKVSRVYLLAGQSDVERSSEEAGNAERARAKAKQAHLAKAEARWLNKWRNKPENASKGRVGNYMGALMDTILGNLQLEIASVHIRFERNGAGSWSQPSALGVTLERLRASTVDSSGKEVFEVGGLASRLFKAVNLSRLAVYACAEEAFEAKEDWASASIAKWEEYFVPGVSLAGPGADSRQYVVPHVCGKLDYMQLGRAAATAEGEPRRRIALHLDTLQLQATDAQVQQAQLLLDVCSRCSLHSRCHVLMGYVSGAADSATCASGCEPPATCQWLWPRDSLPSDGHNFLSSINGPRCMTVAHRAGIRSHRRCQVFLHS
ncbi:hypothetical protein CYMTET_22137 [Cymbomonas tetramitiformis]|uniref:Chorein N-terminal domain-containing protein n=1 Tax=Cymbomonas tetramitiformis TaxID=36881 RepID=A0AAE0L2K9_9CHLO|nr:hypothetical protein CYMTET_22137 [Cymbomonas tetramitiformis]